jgi:hypothetical protein
LEGNLLGAEFSVNFISLVQNLIKGIAVGVGNLPWSGRGFLVEVGLKRQAWMVLGPRHFP